MAKTPKQKLIAVLHDNKALRQLQACANQWFEFLVCPTAPQALDLLKARIDIAAVVAESVACGNQGVAILEQAKKLRPDVRRILFADAEDLSAVVHGLHSGAIEHLVHRPYQPQQILAALMQRPGAAQLASTPLYSASNGQATAA